MKTLWLLSPLALSTLLLIQTTRADVAVNSGVQEPKIIENKLLREVEIQHDTPPREGENYADRCDEVENKKVATARDEEDIVKDDVPTQQIIADMQRLARRLRSFRNTNVLARYNNVPQVQHFDLNDEEEEEEEALAKERAIRKRRRVRRRKIKNKVRRTNRNRHVANRKSLSNSNVNNRKSLRRKDSQKSKHKNTHKNIHSKGRKRSTSRGGKRKRGYRSSKRSLHATNGRNVHQSLRKRNRHGVNKPRRLENDLILFVPKYEISSHQTLGVAEGSQSSELIPQ